MICIVWDGFPQYGARSVKALVESLDTERVIVVARPPAVPDKGMETICGCKVEWIGPNERRSIAEICHEMPRLISISGWKLPIFDQWCYEVHNAGGVAICGLDNNYMLSYLRFSFSDVIIFAREILKAIKFRCFRRWRYDGFFVPGKSGRRLLRMYGVENNAIAEGSYSADASLYSDGLPLARREKRVLFVGQFIKRKNVIRLVKAFADAAEKCGGGWTLELCGSGSLRQRLDELSQIINARLNACHSKIVVRDFVQSEQLADLYKRARIFCLPSLEEHWGLVVHEAALSGCVLVLADTVGALEDLMVNEVAKKSYANGFSFNPYSQHGLREGLVRAMSMDGPSLDAAQKESLRLARNVSIDKFVQGIKRFMELKRE